jgi:urea transport system permease protein
MADLFSSRTLRRALPWVVIVLLALLLPPVLPPFRLNLLGRFLSLGIVALGVDLIWGFTGMLSLGQGTFFSLGGYALGMYLSLNSLEPGQLPEFFSLYGVQSLPAF